MKGSVVYKRGGVPVPQPAVPATAGGSSDEY